ncbi:hypothetical protein FDG2_0134 [Candidatus Protofrankia californiensis]|uniref:Uncharacterized protein n=1 Tax=Candidatus Protofrankia californiensis TaxID=1839754 RepID=A0A1C3NT09_9ACTN|nr:hypothetical protein FDG2_0134 [Candidatus Protofrankia californiensis]
MTLLPVQADLCWFCRQSDPAWRYPLEPVQELVTSLDGTLTIAGPLGAPWWPACEFCRMLFDAKDYETLFTRALTAVLSAEPERDPDETGLQVAERFQTLGARYNGPAQRVPAAVDGLTRG